MKKHDTHPLRPFNEEDLLANRSGVLSESQVQSLTMKSYAGFAASVLIGGLSVFFYIAFQQQSLIFILLFVLGLLLWRLFDHGMPRWWDIREGRVEIVRGQIDAIFFHALIVDGRRYRASGDICDRAEEGMAVVLYVLPRSGYAVNAEVIAMK